MFDSFYDEDDDYNEEDHSTRIIVKVFSAKDPEDISYSKLLKLGRYAVDYLRFPPPPQASYHAFGDRTGVEFGWATDDTTPIYHSLRQKFNPNDSTFIQQHELDTIDIWEITLVKCWWDADSDRFWNDTLATVQSTQAEEEEAERVRLDEIEARAQEQAQAFRPCPSQRVSFHAGPSTNLYSGPPTAPAAPAPMPASLLEARRRAAQQKALLANEAEGSLGAESLPAVAPPITLNLGGPPRLPYTFSSTPKPSSPHKSITRPTISPTAYELLLGDSASNVTHPASLGGSVPASSSIPGPFPSILASNSVGPSIAMERTADPRVAMQISKRPEIAVSTLKTTAPTPAPAPLPASTTTSNSAPRLTSAPVVPVDVTGKPISPHVQATATTLSRVSPGIPTTASHRSLSEAETSHPHNPTATSQTVQSPPTTVPPAGPLKGAPVSSAGAGASRTATGGRKPGTTKVATREGTLPPQLPRPSQSSELRSAAPKTPIPTLSAGTSKSNSSTSPTLAMAKVPGVASRPSTSNSKVAVSKTSTKPSSEPSVLEPVSAGIASPPAASKLPMLVSTQSAGSPVIAPAPALSRTPLESDSVAVTSPISPATVPPSGSSLPCSEDVANTVPAQPEPPGSPPVVNAVLGSVKLMPSITNTGSDSYPGNTTAKKGKAPVPRSATATASRKRVSESSMAPSSAKAKTLKSKPPAVPPRQAKSKTSGISTSASAGSTLASGSSMAPSVPAKPAALKTAPVPVRQARSRTSNASTSAESPSAAGTTTAPVPARAAASKNTSGPVRQAKPKLSNAPTSGGANLAPKSPVKAPTSPLSDAKPPVGQNSLRPPAKVLTESSATPAEASATVTPTPPPPAPVLPRTRSQAKNEGSSKSSPITSRPPITRSTALRSATVTTGQIPEPHSSPTTLPVTAPSSSNNTSSILPKLERESPSLVSNNNTTSMDTKARNTSDVSSDSSVLLPSPSPLCSTVTSSANGSTLTKREPTSLDIGAQKPEGSVATSPELPTAMGPDDEIRVKVEDIDEELAQAVLSATATSTAGPSMGPVTSSPLPRGHKRPSDENSMEPHNTPLPAAKRVKREPGPSVIPSALPAPLSIRRDRAALSATRTDSETKVFPPRVSTSPAGVVEKENLTAAAQEQANVATTSTSTVNVSKTAHSTPSKSRKRSSSEISADARSSMSLGRGDAASSPAKRLQLDTSSSTKNAPASSKTKRRSNELATPSESEAKLRGASRREAAVQTVQRDAAHRDAGPAAERQEKEKLERELAVTQTRLQAAELLVRTVRKKGDRNEAIAESFRQEVEREELDELNSKLRVSQINLKNERTRSSIQGQENEGLKKEVERAQEELRASNALVDSLRAELEQEKTRRKEVEGVVDDIRQYLSRLQRVA